ncbi:hypothetical protein G6O67_002607 [Ophiocordyceps sinensis]|uniref:Uncharacterized protein n=2 Tax=Ophiocordyceps sinensis TaxID=72228 RepID=A0A8H4V7G4_9HYPO|nr:hypothetical protein OCS_00011 [Ophiocordyceps sinensis CO18]KAF4510739.1 hypothetical protein G6O67_002607 [Ophiocordyceps sinensis]
MTNGLDRLERLFAYKRRASPGPSPRPSNAVQLSEPQFPSPSFIRPKTTRMAARDEVRLRQAAGRSPSVPNILPTQRMGSHAQLSTRPESPLRPKYMPTRSPSFNNRRVDHLVAGLRDFQFPKPSSRDESSPAPAASNSLPFEIPQLPSPRCRSPFEMAIPSGRLDTPPCSDPEDNGLFLPTPPNKVLPEVACRAPPTPEETPEFGPVSDSQLRGSRSLDAIENSTSKALLSDIGDSFDQLSLHRSYSQSSIAPSAQLSFCSSTLREPDFNEFLNLSDDDIAESTPESPLLESHDEARPSLPPMGLSISSSQPLTSSLLTLTPPRTSRPAAVAAFEAARIARRYDFDLVYVVNLWPDHASTGLCDSELEGAASHESKVGPKPMMGRLLAAHGLHHVPSPLQISSLVHTTILRSDGWIEYRNLEAHGHDLARGYASAFYTGQYTRNGGSDASGPVSGVRLSERIDRGIVFAAYRKPRPGEDRLGRTFCEEELGELHGEAEALVEMLIDIHVANRLRQPPTQPSVPDETGPMPLQEPKIT